MKYDFDLIIGESDSNEESKGIVEKYRGQGYKNIHYWFFDGDIESEMKVQKLCEMGASEYEYLMICRDRNIIDIGQVGDRLTSLLNKKYTIISFLTSDRTNRIDEFQSREYINKIEFFHDLYWNLTSWGNSIINNELASYFSKIDRTLKGSDNSFFLLETMFTYIADIKEFKAYNLVDDILLETNKSTSTWKFKDRMLDIWAKAWCESIDRLPEIYDDEKAYVKYTRSMYYNGFSSIKNLLSFRADGDFTIESVRRNKKYIPMMSKTSIIWFYLISIMPKKPLSYLKYKIKKMDRPVIE